MIADRLAPKSEPQAGLDFGEEDEDEEEMGYAKTTDGENRPSGEQGYGAATQTRSQKANNDTPMLDTFGPT